MLPEAISEALEISLSEVLGLYFGGISEEQRDRHVWDAIDRRRMNVEDESWVSEVLGLYFGGISEEQRDRHVWDAIDRRRMNVEDEAWLEAESRRMDVVAEMVHHGGDDTYWTL
jgi:flavin-binding protein dodecin